MIIFAIFLFELLGLFFISQALTKALSQLFFQITKSEKVTIHLLSILFLPGVIIHELAHFLMASILFVPTGQIEFLPQLTQNSVKLGSVAIAKTDPIRRALIGLAPVFAGLSILFGSLFYIASLYATEGTVDAWKIVLLVYVLFEVSNTMFSSKKDVEGTVEIFGALLFLTALFFLLGEKIPESIATFMHSDVFIQRMEYITTLLLFPLGIDVIALTITKMLVRRS